MKTALELRQERECVVVKMTDLGEALEGEPWSDEQRTEFDSYKLRVGHLDQLIDAADSLEAAKVRHTAPPPVPPQPAPAPETRSTDSALRIPERHWAVPAGPTPRGFGSQDQAHRAGRWVAAALFGHPESRDWCLDNGFSVRALSTTSNVAGGALVPSEMENAIINLREEYGTARQKCRVFPMSSDTYTIPRRTGGLTGYYIADNSEVTASDPTFDNVQLTARKLAALVKVSSELAEDAVIDMASFIAEEAALIFSTEEDQALFLGTGASTYGGIEGLITACTTATATRVLATAGNLAFSTLDAVDFLGMIGKLPQFPGIQPEWYIHKAGWAASMLRLQAAAGGNTIATLQDGAGRYAYMGYPVNFVQCMNSTLADQANAAGICYLGDLRMATTMGNRRGIGLKVSTDRYLEFDQIGILATERYDINVHDVGDTSIAGAVVMLYLPAA